MPRYFAFNKPFNVLSQFSPEGDKKTLAHFFPDLPKNIYPVGRLDYDSEGLIILTDDKLLTHRLLDPKQNHPRTYLIQVDGEITPDAIKKLEPGVQINVDGKIYKTKKTAAKIISQPSWLWDRDPPVRFRKEIPTSWLQLTLTEGKNRQVRKMTAAVGFPTLRLIRFAIGSLTIDSILPGYFIELGTEIKNKLFAG